VAARFEEAGTSAEIVVVETQGDRVQDRAFAEVGSPGVFVAEIEAALLDGRVDVAVHSYKDMPSESPPELVVAAVPERMDPADRLLAHPDKLDDDGEPVRGARIGTASARRAALLRHARPDVEIGLLRGNLPTRVRKALDGTFDAIVLAAAGLDRIDRAAADKPELALSREGIVERRLDPEVFVPAPSQGALALQARRADEATRRALAALDDEHVHAAVQVERALLARVEGGCQVPFGAWCRHLDDGRLELRAVLEREGTLFRAGEIGTEPRGLVEAAWSKLTEGDVGNVGHVE
jgi:hydroxymethylbilane synthase